MRPVDKGVAPKEYADYKKARHDLAERIGYYCSYCEMSVKNMIEVEHVHPLHNGGDETDWENFLLSCKYCNTVKNNCNEGREGYLWPDTDNTDLAFKYSEENGIQVKEGLPDEQEESARKTILLMGLDRYPGGENEPTEADTRWRSRKEAWDLAQKAYNDWTEAPIPQMAKAIARTSLCGHYSIWTEVFKNVPEVLGELDNVYREKGLFKKYDNEGNRIVRERGII